MVFAWILTMLVLLAQPAGVFALCEDLYAKNRLANHLEQIMGEMAPQVLHPEIDLEIGKGDCVNHPHKMLQWLVDHGEVEILREYYVFYMVRPKLEPIGRRWFVGSSGSAVPIEKQSFLPSGAQAEPGQRWYYHFVLFHRPSQTVYDPEIPGPHSSREYFQRYQESGIYVYSIEGIRFFTQVPDARWAPESVVLQAIESEIVSTGNAVKLERLQ